jgi:hypothetical protein
MVIDIHCNISIIGQGCMNPETLESLNADYNLFLL